MLDLRISPIVIDVSVSQTSSQKATVLGLNRKIILIIDNRDCIIYFIIKIIYFHM